MKYGGRRSEGRERVKRAGAKGEEWRNDRRWRAVFRAAVKGDGVKGYRRRSE
jgi:hypothetical protein